MKKFLMSYLIILVTLSSAFAQQSKKKTSQTPSDKKSHSATISSFNEEFNNLEEKLIKASLGLQGGGLNLGVEYEVRKTHQNIAGYFLLGMEKSDIAKPQIMLFGASLPIYIFEKNKYSASINPAVGLGTMKIGTGSSEFFLGPQLKWVAFYKMSPKLSLGLEHLIFTNWLNSKLPFSDSSLTQVLLIFDL